MLHRSNPALKGLTIGLLLLVLILPVAIQRSSANTCKPVSCRSLDNGGWAIGTWWNYNSYWFSKGSAYYENDFAVETYQTSGSFSSSGSNPVNYVLTDSVNGYAPQVAIQFAPSGTSFCLNDQIWVFGSSSPLFQTCHTVGGPASYVIETYITQTSGIWYVNWALNNVWYNSWSVGQSYFDPEMNPSFVIESADTNTNDFGSSFGWASDYMITNYQLYGTQQTLGGSNPVQWYGGLWGMNSANTNYVDHAQTTQYFVGSSTVAPPSVAVGGKLYNNGNGIFNSYECGIGNYNYFSGYIDDYLAQLMSSSGGDASMQNMC